MSDSPTHAVVEPELIDRAAALWAPGRRAILGICGAPGAGKTTLVRALLSALEAREVPTAWVPLDGFHLGDGALRSMGRLERKGAIDTFDGWGYLSLLRRVRAEHDREVFAPGFERDLEQPIAADLIVPPGPALVLTEGNYLLDASEPWSLVAEELDEVWFVETDNAERIERLVARHVFFGKSPKEARTWVEAVDEPNARRVAASRERADLIVQR